ncbi:oligosaccharide flippase family protein [Paracoccus caeni]|uniref:Oligosaccharide flippase family protein n=1 Tax=Paracoccus caeni TaxID=657651 RepID=A0A934W0J3_9RHOB|nr:oligosaccharide flippase family protein [Paracoccus caeni]MBK4218147.1 oligosaccharide flippase family protein [Paracoccus caeni]
MRSRALRGTAITLGGTAGQQLLRLISNLILTRLLFPEAFGLMALIQTFMVGLQMFSDIGLRPSIIQNKRGEEADFLNTAWTIQVIRGVVLWLAACALAWPLSIFYMEPQILQLLPVVGLNALLMGFATTKTSTANRNLQLGRLTVIGMITQALGIVITIACALVWPSVWALVIGSLIGTLATVIAGHWFMPGIANRFRWDRSAAYELIRFGRFIFVSTLAGFFVNQGDKIVLGKLVSFADLGIYNIGFFMASFPLMLGAAVAERVLFPLYRQVRPSESPESRTKIRRARSLLTGSLIVLLGILAVISNLLIGLLYDPRYAAAGPILIVLVLMQLPVALTIGNSQLLLAEGNSRDFSKLVLLQAVLNFIYMLAGFWLFGIFGVLLVQGLITLTIYPLQQYYLRRHHGTDLQRDAQFALIGLAFAVLAIWWNWEVLSQFFITSRAAAPFLTGSWHPATVFGG